MYLDHFHFVERPFSLTPDTGYYYNNFSCQEAMNVILVALESGEGIIKITGEVGTGKTMMCRKLLNDLPDEMVTVYLPNPLMEPQQLYRAVAQELGLDAVADISVADLLNRLNVRLINLAASGRQVVVCVDEAQSMPVETLEALRLLSNVETEKRKLLQIILFGQPELNQRLAGKDLRQLRQRIGFSYTLKPLTFDGFQGYLCHRLHVAGYGGGELFTNGAQRQLYRAARGIPRLVNILAHKSLMAAYGRGATRIGRRQVKQAIADTDDVSCSTRQWSVIVFGAVVVLLSCYFGIKTAHYFFG
ncbi:MAG: AAA family ATPase [Desulfobacteraceae bacterium 4572_35.1]|nr:MAG: AAA family ATPase [Desulfobacteraceae bacterium 4572_35.1]